jgi:hypothetical protein
VLARFLVFNLQCPPGAAQPFFFAPPEPFVSRIRREASKMISDQDDAARIRFLALFFLDIAEAAEYLCKVI